jgi:hypothetical protein
LSSATLRCKPRSKRSLVARVCLFPAKFRRPPVVPPPRAAAPPPRIACGPPWPPDRQRTTLIKRRHTPSASPRWTSGPSPPPGPWPLPTVRSRSSGSDPPSPRVNIPHIGQPRPFYKKNPALSNITYMPFHLQRFLQFSSGFHGEAPELLCFFHQRSKLRTMCGSRTSGWSLPCVMSD